MVLADTDTALDQDHMDLAVTEAKVDTAELVVLEAKVEPADQAALEAQALVRR